MPLIYIFFYDETKLWQNFNLKRNILRNSDDFYFISISIMIPFPLQILPEIVSSSNVWSARACLIRHPNPIGELTLGLNQDRF